MRKKNIIMCSWAAVIITIACGASVHAFIFEIVPSKGPDGLGSVVTFNTYAANAVNSLENNLGTVGNPSTDPTAYAPKTTVSPNVYRGSATEMIFSGFASWDAQANPTGNFATQTGNRIYFGVRILGEGTKFALHNLEFDADSNDASNFFDPLFRNFNGSTYNPRRIGIDYGADNAKGGGDDIIYMNSESGSLTIDELIYVGEDVALSSGSSQPTDQGNLDNAVGVINNLGIFSILGTYNLYDPSDTTHSGTPIATGTAELLIPEPSSVALLAAGLLVISNRRPRKPKQA